MKTFKTSNFILMLLSIFVTGINAQAKMSLDDAIKYALTHSNSITNSKLGVKDAELRIKEVKASGLPQLNADVSLQHFFIVPESLLPDFISPSVYGVLEKEGVKNGSGSTVQSPQASTQFFKAAFTQPNSISGSLTLGQLLFSGSYTVGLRAAKLSREYADLQLSMKQIETKNQVIDAYLPSLLLSENVLTLDKNIDNLTKLLNETNALYKGGFVEELDVDRLQLALSNLKTLRETLIKQKEMVLNGLKLSMNIDAKENIEIADDLNKLLAEADLNIVKDEINFTNREEYKTLSKVIELNKLNVDLNRAGYLPTVAAFASYSQQFQGRELSKLVNIPNMLVGISGKVNIWDSYEKKTKIQRAQLQLEQFNNQKKDLESVINLQVSNAKIAYNNSQNQVENQKKNLVLAEKIYKTTTIKYKEGIGSSFELVQAEQAVFQSQQNLKQAQYDLLIAYKNLQKALGK
jgi:outer membrane protein